MNVCNLLSTVVLWTAALATASPAFAENSAALSADDGTTVFASAKLTTLQDIDGRATLGASAASVGQDVLRAASGNVGVNIAAGALNAQANQIALVSTPQAEIVTQQNVHATARISGMSGSGVAELGAGALAAVSGNVGINIASGVGNAQVNALAVH
ncbi:hypothetical protein [Paraburkholderia sp. J67]|uniref:hypothetical protein n=1 Tax=Paraburkholderia sp. J67 TaxID=2805435 RepID=UPI002ABDF47E|nr:hypothetical protein [Paraburkholderia sp. J67]